MADQKQKAVPVDIEQRTIKKWGTNTFVSMLNTVPSVSNKIHQSLLAGLKEIEDELNEVGENGSDLFPINTEDAEETLLTGPKERVLTKVLYRMSAFFSSMKMVSISHVKIGSKMKPAVRLHQEIGEGLRMAQSIDPVDLDPFNQYVFLHMIPFIQAEWRRRRERDDWKKYRKAVEEVVQAKIAALNAPPKPTVESAEEA